MASTLLSTCSVFSSTDDSTVSTCDLSLLEEAVEAGSVVIYVHRGYIISNKLLTMSVD